MNYQFFVVTALLWTIASPTEIKDRSINYPAEEELTPLKFAGPSGGSYGPFPTPAPFIPDKDVPAYLIELSKPSFYPPTTAKPESRYPVPPPLNPYPMPPPHPRPYPIHPPEVIVEPTYIPSVPHPTPSYPKPSYPKPSYPKPSYPKPSYPKPSYPKPSYPQPSYPKPSYPIPSYILEDSIPGIPGKDYPIYSVVPPVSYKCNPKYPGFYADMKSGCQAWLYCQLDGRQDVFLCPNGTIFNQKYFVCDWWYNVDCSQSEAFYALNGNLYQEPEKPHHGGTGYHPSGPSYYQPPPPPQPPRPSGPSSYYPEQTSSSEIDYRRGKKQ